MRTRVWCIGLVLVTLGVACGDQPTEVVVDREVAEGVGMSRAPLMMANATASSDDGLTISTDKDDYQPGDTVYLSGAGWPVSDTLDILLEDEPATHEPHTWWVPVAEDGTFRDSTYVVDIGDVDVTFTLTATSRASGRSLAVQFTDATIQNSLAIDPQSASVLRGSFADYTVAIEFTGNETPCTTTLNVTGLSAGTSFAFNPASVTGHSGDTPKTTTLRLTTTASTPLGQDGFTVRAPAVSANGCGGAERTVNGTINVTGPATKLVFGQQPSSGEAAMPIAPAVTVRINDASNNLVGSSTAPITLAIGTNPGSGTLGGTLTRNAVNGVATFNNLTIDKIGNGYTLTATSSGLSGATSSAFNITPGAAAKLAFFAQPSGGAPNTAFATQPRVEVLDAGGNRKASGTGSAASISLAIVPASGTAGDALTCTTNPVSASAGLGTFAGCRINLAGTDYRLRATSPGLTSADSDPFDVTAVNQLPMVDAGGPYNVAEGTALTLTPTVNDPDGDPLIYEWSVNTGGIDAGGTCTFDNPTMKNAKLTCTDDSQGAPGGKFTLTLEVRDGPAPAVTDHSDLTVTNAAPAASAGGPYSGDEGSAIQLGGSGDDAGNNDDSGLTYKWTAVTTGIDANGTCTFDDDDSKTAKVTCTDDGAVKVQLVVKDDDGGTSAASEANLTVGNAGPVAEAGGPYNGNEGSPVQLNGAVTDAGTNDTHTWLWKYVSGAGIDGGTCSFDDENAQDPKITCTDDGTVQVTLKVTDDDGADAEDTATLTLANVNPVATAGGPYSGNEGAAIQLTGTATDAGSNDVLTRQWTYAPVSGVDGGAACSFSPNASALSPTMSCTDDGVYKVTLTVSDDDGGSDAADASVTLANADPVANAGPDYTGSEGTPVQLNGSVTDAGSNDTHTWSWQYVGTDVDPGATCTISNPGAEDPTITCTDDGVVELTLQVTDDDGGVGTDKAKLTLANVAPVVIAGGPYLSVEGTGVTLGGSATDRGANDTHTYKWTVDDSGIDGGGNCTISDDTNPAATVTCDDNGTLTVSLVATDDDGTASTGSQATVTVANANPVITAFTKADGTPLPATMIVAGTLGLEATFGDAGTNDSHTLEVDCGSGTFAVSTATTSPATGSCSFPSIGSTTIRVRVADDDGGSHVLSHTLLVKYDFDGFFAPVDRPNTMNVSKAGQAIPLKWTLKNASGAPVTDLATVTVRAVGIPCALGASSDQVEEYASGSSGLQNFGDGRYQFNWKTPSAYAASCKSIELVFASGGVSYTEGPHALFSFRK